MVFPIAGPPLFDLAYTQFPRTCMIKTSLLRITISLQYTVAFCRTHTLPHRRHDIPHPPYPPPLHRPNTQDAALPPPVPSGGRYALGSALRWMALNA